MTTRYSSSTSFSGSMSSLSPTSPRKSSFSSSGIRSSQYIAHEERDWVEIQKSTFTNWCNEQIRDTGIVITDLGTAFEDGVTIVYLVEAVSMKKCGRYNKAPKLYAQKLENTTQALKVLENDGIQLVNIGNDDLVNGNVKLILGLLWRLILHYQISSSGSASGKQLLLLWLRNALPDCEIKNVTTDWNDGTLLSALLNFCDPTLMKDWRDMDPDDRLTNVTRAMRCAEDKFRIPLIITPESFVSPYVDELSMMTYLSFFTQPGSCGEKKTLEIINKAAPGIHARNFNTDWNDGRAINMFLEAQCPGMVPEYEDIDDMTPIQRVDIALNSAGDKLGVKKVITPKEMTSPDVDELSVMAYMLQFRNCEKLRSHAHTFTAEGAGIRHAYRGRAAEFTVYGRRDLGLESSRIEVRGPRGENVPVTVKQTLDGLKVHFTPQASGSHKVSITHVGQHIPDSPFTVEVLEDVSDTQVSGQGLKNAVVMRPAEFVIIVHGGTNAEVTATAEGPTRSSPVRVSRNQDGSYTASFVPNEVGEHKITVFVGSTPLPGTPFVTKVGDPGNVMLAPADTARNPTIGEPVQFEVDTTRAGLGELAIKCKGPAGGIPVDVRATSRGRYMVSYVPSSPGEYVTHCTFNGEEVPASPLTSVVGDPDKIVAHGEGLYQVALESPAEFFITLHGAARDGLEVSGEGPYGHFPVALVESDIDEDTYTVRYTPQGVGIHKIHVRYAQRPVKGSPFIVKVADPSKVRLLSQSQSQSQRSGKGYVIRRQVEIPVEVPFEAGEGLLEASAVGPNLETLPTSVNKEADGKHYIRFVPMEAGTHTINVKYGGVEVSNSPYRVRVGDPSSVRVRESVQTRSGYNTMTEVDIPIEVDDEFGEISASVQGPHNEHVPSTLTQEGDGYYHVRFQPMTGGKFTVDVRCAGHPIDNSPMIMDVVETTPPVQVKLKEFEKQETIRYRVRQEVDIPMEIPMQVTEVSAEVRGPSNEHVISSFNRESDGYHHLRYVPFAKGKYNVDVRCKGQSVEGSPFSMNVGDPSNTLVRLREPELVENQYIVRRELDIAMDIPDDHWQVTSEVRGPDEEILQSSIGKGDEGYYHVKFVPIRPGKYKVHVRCDGEPVENSPFIIKVGEPEPTAVAHVRSEELFAERVIQNEVDLKVESSSEMDDSLFSSNVIGPDGNDIPCSLNRDHMGHHHVKFTPVRHGEYKVYVRYGNELVEGAPFLVNVTEQTKAVVNVHDHDKFYQLYEVEIPVDVPIGTNPNELNVTLTDPEGRPAKCTVVRGRDSSQLFIRFVPQLSGYYRLNAQYQGQETEGSPYSILVLPPEVTVESKKVVASGPGLTGAYVNERAEFLVDARQGGNGELSARLSGVKHNADVEIQRRSDSHYVCHYTAPHSGAYVLSIKWNGRDIKNSPYKVTVKDRQASTSVVDGPLTRNDFVTYANTVTQFTVVTQYGIGKLYVRCQGPTRDCDIEVLDNQDGTCSVKVFPTEVGNHFVYVEYDGMPVHGSPFMFRVGQQADASKVQAYGPGLYHGLRHNYTGQFKVETKGAGPGTLKIRIHGPKGAFKVEMFRDRSSRSEVLGDKNKDSRCIGVKYNPTETGRYTIHIKWGDEHINGSPFEVFIYETQEELDQLNELQDHAITHHNSQQIHL